MLAPRSAPRDRARSVVFEWLRVSRGNVVSSVSQRDADQRGADNFRGAPPGPVENERRYHDRGRVERPPDALATPIILLTRSPQQQKFILSGVALILFSALIQFAALRTNPPGFFLDESSIAYNAHTLSQSGRDEHGEEWPLFFRAFGEFKNPVYIYLLAGVFRLTGPGFVDRKSTRLNSSHVALSRMPS